jgi:hypothetical protein
MIMKSKEAKMNSKQKGRFCNTLKTFI